MHRRQPLPRLWLITDERQGDALWGALAKLPRGSGVVFRHYEMPAAERKALFGRVRHMAGKRRLTLLLAGEERGWRGAAGVHNSPKISPSVLCSRSAHNLKEIRRAEREGADLLFISPIFPTRSHRGAKTLGRMGLAKLVRETALPVIALGGINARRARSLRSLGIYGWAAIDAWTA